MKKILFSIAILALIGAGCSVKSGEQNLSAGLNEYQIQAVKSEVNKNTLNLKAKSPVTMKELLNQPEVKFKAELRDGKETVVLLDGVIATASKSWNLYVNDQKVDFVGLEQVSVKAGDKIEWKYENIK